MNKIKKIIASVGLTLFCFGLPLIALAQDDTSELTIFVRAWYMKLLIPIGVILAGFMIMYGGITYAMSAGDASKVQKGKEYIFGAISGLILLLSAAAIITYIIK